MNLLDIIPGINSILDKVITSPKEKAELQTKLKELDIRELEAKAQVQASWLSNKSLFVSGAIPSILWMMVLVIFFNFILSPIAAAFGYTMPILDLPVWYADLCGTIVLGLFAKKAWDSTDMSLGSMSKKSKYESEVDTTYNMVMKSSAHTEENIVSSVPTNTDVKKSPTTVTETKVISKPIKENKTVSKEKEIKESSTPTNTTSKETVKSDKPNYDDPDYINMRLQQMQAELESKGK